MNAMRHFSFAPRAASARRRAAAVAFAIAVIFAVHPATHRAGETPAPAPMLCNQPASEYKTRRGKLLEQVRDGVVILQGNVEESLGVNEKFHQNENFLYLTGIETPGAVIVLTPFGYQGKRSLLFLPRRNPQTERWTGPQIGPDDEDAKAFGFDATFPTSELARVLREMNGEEFAKRGGKVYVADALSLATPRDRDFADKIQQAFPKAPVSDVRPVIHEMRKVKSGSEIALLQKAVDITGEAQRDVAKALAPGKYEYEMEALILAAFFRNGAERVGFPCIVGSGINATTLHYNRNRKRIESGDLVIVDIGAEYSGYTADITRTYPASGKFTARQREIYQLVLDAQTAAAAAFVPGKTTMNDLNLVVRDFFHASKLRAGNNLTMDAFFLHGLGHYIGLYVHDVGGYGGPLPVGAVITIEPGLYVPGEKIGVRIEDDYLVTEKGLVKLSKDIPSDPDEIERLLSEASRRAS
jgi:Xaa-Pro aminopeptidase